jgi:hypothetical protein
MERKGTTGSLRKALGKKEGETITEAELNAAMKKPGLKKKALFAKNVRKKRK